MALFRKKPVVIDAVQWDGIKLSEPAIWVRDAVNGRGAPDTHPGTIMRMGGDLHIGTLEGVMIARKGDWIIKGVKGEIYPCKPDIFDATYEPAEAAS